MTARQIEEPGLIFRDDCRFTGNNRIRNIQIFLFIEFWTRWLVTRQVQ